MGRRILKDARSGDPRGFRVGGSFKAKLEVAPKAAPMLSMAMNSRGRRKKVGMCIRAMLEERMMRMVQRDVNDA